jgi:hypothetical protein
MEIVVNFTLRPPYPKKKGPGTHWIEGGWHTDSLKIRVIFALQKLQIWVY